MLTLSKRKTFSMNLKLQIDSIFDSLRKTRPHFLFCLLPTLLANDSSSTGCTNSTDVSLMRSQLKSYQLLAAARIYRQGYPEHFNYEEFERRFAMFLPTSAGQQHTSTSSLVTNHQQSTPELMKTTSTSLANGSGNNNSNNDTHKQACVNILKSMDLDSSLWRLGSTQVFFKAGVLARLEEQRAERVDSLVVRLQAVARRFLAEKSFDKKRVSV